MKKNVLSLLALICVAVCSFTIAGCADKDLYDPDKNPNGVDKNPSTLDFATSKTVKLQLNYDVANGFKSTFDLYTDSPLANDGSLRSDLKPIARGINITGQSQLTRIIPTYVTDLYLYSGSMFVPLLSHAKVENGTASFSQMDIPAPQQEPSSRAGNAGTMWSRESIATLKTKEDFYLKTENGNFQYDIINPDFKQEIPVEVLNSIRATFPEYKKLPDDSPYIKDANLVVVEDAELFISILHTGCTLKNSLSYFVYTGTKDFSELTKEEVNQLKIITAFQLSEANTNSARKDKWGITPGKYIQLKYLNEDGELVNKFPKGAKVGWKLHRGGFNESEFKAGNGYGSAFSVSEWNDPKRLNDGQGGVTETGIPNYTIYFSTTDNAGNKFNCFGFEDQNYKPDEDYNDLVFHIYSNPVNALDPPPSITDEDIEITEEKNGILAFEDYWPEKFDYDMNDVVVKYSSEITYLQKIEKTNGKITKSSDVMVKKVEDTFSLIHSGATYNNAFSYKIDLPLTAVESISITDEKTNQTTDYTNKATVDKNGFIIDLCESVKNLNPTKEKPQTYKVVIEFKEEAVLQDDFADICAPYNPFISPKETEGAEVHLPMYPPTQRADMELFGTKDDRSDKVNIWYVSGENIKFPFAIHLAGAEDFEIPTEGKDISKTYPRYLDWVNSKMTEHKDWYK